MRSCIVCNGKHSKRQMLRLVYKGEQADIVPDITQTADGRGRYICSCECAKKLLDIKLLRRAFRMNLTLAKAEALLKALADCDWK